MAKIANFICVTDIGKNENGDTLLLEPLTTFGLENLPNNFSFAVFFSIVDVHWTEDDKHLMDLEIKSPDGNKPIDVKGIEIPITNEEGKLIADISASFSLKNTKFTSTGLHEMKLTINDGEIEASTYFVVQ